MSAATAVFMVDLLANRQKQRRVISLQPGCQDGDAGHPSSTNPHTNASERGSTSVATRNYDDDDHDDRSTMSVVASSVQRHVRVASSNDVVLQNPGAYAAFLELWMQEGLSRFILTQKSKRS